MNNKIFYNNNSILIDGEGCDTLFLDFIKKLNFDNLLKLKTKNIFISLPQVQESLFDDIIEKLDNIIEKSSFTIIPIVNDYGTLNYFSNKKYKYIIGRILLTHHTQSSSLNLVKDFFRDDNLIGFTFDAFLFKFVLNNKISLRLFSDISLKIFIGYNNFLSTSHECKFINYGQKCNFECTKGHNNISLLLGKGNIIGKNLYLQKTKTSDDFKFDYIFS